MFEILLRWYNVAALFAVLAVNRFAETEPVKGMTTGEISAMFPVQITPAPYAFAIWGLIYALLLGFVIVQFLPSKRGRHELRSIGPWFGVTCVFNIAWLLLWQSLNITSSLFAMLGLLLSLAVIYANTRPHGWSEDQAVRWWLQVPFSLYFGWVTAAAIVNTAVVFYANGWDGFGWPETFWTVLMILIVSLLSLLIGFLRKDPFYMLATVWALVAIGAANQGNGTLGYMAWGAAGLLFAYAVLLIFANGWLNRRGRDEIEEGRAGHFISG
ncbi:hypothetical protein [Paenibacillus sp. 32352]|uniref:hypothetical protein n=1 Tax=Paenibacillus sp. 32352 TaxID=1969111 RepID=UPI0009AC1777|nr:hypothetical protein [Paenibacillus sp. 32352]